MRFLDDRHSLEDKSYILYLSFFLILFFIGEVGIAASTVGVGSRVNCPGSYLNSGSGKVCQAAPEYSDIIYLGEKSRKSCPPTYTLVNAGKSKWCVTYPDPLLTD